MYGDRDYACSHLGDENSSLAVDYWRASDFKDAGYTPILSLVGVAGHVRQFGNYAFSRVYQAGHEGSKNVQGCLSGADTHVIVPLYQPEIAYEILCVLY